MALVSVEGEPGRQVVRYRPEDVAGKERKRVKLILKAMVFFGVLSVLTIAQIVFPLIDFGFVLSEALLQDPESDAEMRDLGRIMDTFVAFGAIAAMALMVYIPGRLVMAHRRVDRGAPVTWLMLRRLAIVQILLECSKLVVLEGLGTELETMHVSYGGAPNLLFAPLLLWYLQRPELRRFFSVHKLEPVDAPTGPAAPGWQAVPSPGFAPHGAAVSDEADERVR